MTSLGAELAPLLYNSSVRHDDMIMDTSYNDEKPQPLWRNAIPPLLYQISCMQLPIHKFQDLTIHPTVHPVVSVTIRPLMLFECRRRHAKLLFISDLHLAVVSRLPLRGTPSATHGCTIDLVLHRPQPVVHFDQSIHLFYCWRRLRRQVAVKALIVRIVLLEPLCLMDHVAGDRR